MIDLAKSFRSKPPTCDRVPRCEWLRRELLMHAGESLTREARVSIANYLQRNNARGELPIYTVIDEFGALSAAEVGSMRHSEV